MRTLRTRAEVRFARTMTALSPRVMTRLAGGAPLRIDGQTMDPQVQLILRLRRINGPGNVIAGSDVESARARMRAETYPQGGRPAVGGPVRDLRIDGAQTTLAARHYHPGGDGPLPLIVFFHGGGHALGDLDTHDNPCRILCRHAGAHLLAVDYRLTPEHPFPAGIEDAVAAFRWAVANAAELGADPARVAVCGDSAGANMSAVVSQLLARGDGPRPALQVLIYPSSERSRRWPSEDLFATGCALTADDMETFAALYGDCDASDPRVSPLLGDLSDLPPAIVVTAGFDPLRDEGDAYADALRAAGTAVLHRRFDGLAHGFLNMAGVSSSCHAAVVEIAGATRAALALAPVSAAA